MNAVCTCPEVDPVKRATTYTALMGVEPHAATCPRNGRRIVEPTEVERMAAAIHGALYDERRLTWGQARAAARVALEAAAEARR